MTKYPGRTVSKLPLRRLYIVLIILFFFDPLMIVKCMGAETRESRRRAAWYGWAFTNLGFGAYQNT